MNLSRKTTLFVAILASISISILVAISVYSFRVMYLQSAEKQAHIAAEIVRVHLTESMVNGSINKRGQFFDRLHLVRDLLHTRVIRSPKVVNQYGAGILNESSADEIEKQVLRTGTAYFEIVENQDEPYLRASIPYVADASGTPNCLACHQVTEGDVLGVITLQILIKEQRHQAQITAILVFVIMVLFGLGIGIYARRTLRPLIDIANQLQNTVDKAQQGDYSSRIDSNRADELGHIAAGLNELLEHLHQGLQTISQKVSRLIHYNAPVASTNILETTIEIVDSLTDVSSFKQSIEEDETTAEVYARLAKILRDEFLISHFAIYEVDKNKNRLIRVNLDDKENDGYSWCDPQILVRADTCRAKRTGHTVDGVLQSGICTAFQPCQETTECRHICVPVLQSGSVGSVVQLLTDEVQAHLLQRMMPFIQIYLRESAPVLESKHLMETLRETSLRDPMTGLHNRRFLQEYTETLTSYTDRHKASFAVLMADLDFFKQVNDTYGHEAGDATIKQLAQLFKTTLRDSDLIIRYGGEEFLILLRDTTPESALTTAEKVRAEVESLKIQIPGGSINKTISIGVANYPSDSTTFWQTVKFADVALYKAKETGRNRVIAFEPEMWDGDTSY